MDLPPPSILGRISDRLFFPLVIVAEVCGLLSVILIGVWVGYFSSPGFVWSSFGRLDMHPFVMTLGMLFIFGSSTLSYRVLGRLHIPRKIIKTIHGTMMMTVIASTAFGIYLVVSSFIGKSFKSVHAMLGIVTTTLFVLQFIFAATIFVLPLAPNWLRASYMRVHAFFGMLTLMSATASCLTGIQIGQSVFAYNTKLYLSAGMFIATFTSIVIYILTTEAYRVRKPHPIIQASNNI